jgi:uncharacterized coiled-coil DUF342 family protein
MQDQRQTASNGLTTSLQQVAVLTEERDKLAKEGAEAGAEAMDKLAKEGAESADLEAELKQLREQVASLTEERDKLAKECAEADICRSTVFDSGRTAHVRYM